MALDSASLKFILSDCENAWNELFPSLMKRVKYILESVSSGLLLTLLLCLLPFLVFCFLCLALLHTTYALKSQYAIVVQRPCDAVSALSRLRCPKIRGCQQEPGGHYWEKVGIQSLALFPQFQKKRYFSYSSRIIPV